MMAFQVTDIPPAVINVTECCANNNVSARCLDICSFSIDYDLMKARPDCLPEFHSMMQCASDGEISSKTKYGPFLTNLIP